MEKAYGFKNIIFSCMFDYFHECGEFDSCDLLIFFCMFEYFHKCGEFD